jgi:hypothetical protein
VRLPETELKHVNQLTGLKLTIGQVSQAKGQVSIVHVPIDQVSLLANIRSDSESKPGWFVCARHGIKYLICLSCLMNHKYALSEQKIRPGGRPEVGSGV